MVLGFFKGLRWPFPATFKRETFCVCPARLPIGVENSELAVATFSSGGNHFFVLRWLFDKITQNHGILYLAAVSSYSSSSSSKKKFCVCVFACVGASLSNNHARIFSLSSFLIARNFYRQTTTPMFELHQAFGCKVPARVSVTSHSGKKL